MNKKIKIIDLLCLISNGEEVPTYVRYINFVKNKEDIMMVCKENIIYKLDQLEIHLNDEVEIIEDKDIPLIPDDELWKIENNDATNYRLNYNFKVLQEKINQILEELNKRQ